MNVFDKSEFRNLYVVESIGLFVDSHFARSLWCVNVVGGVEMRVEILQAVLSTCCMGRQERYTP
jgi:hypothetical protein